jgi:hypothetical protein
LRSEDVRGTLQGKVGFQQFHTHLHFSINNAKWRVLTSPLKISQRVINNPDLQQPSLATPIFHAPYAVHRYYANIMEGRRDWVFKSSSTPLLGQIRDVMGQPQIVSSGLSVNPRADHADSKENSPATFTDLLQVKATITTKDLNPKACGHLPTDAEARPQPAMRLPRCYDTADAKVHSRHSSGASSAGRSEMQQIHTPRGESATFRECTYRLQRRSQSVPRL